MLEVCEFSGIQDVSPIFLPTPEHSRPDLWYNGDLQLNNLRPAPGDTKG